MIDMEKDIPIPKQEDLQGIAALGVLQQQLTSSVADLENSLSLLKEELRQVVEVALPESMLNLGLTSFALQDGTKLQIKTFYRGSISKANEVEAFKWLNTNGHADLIKNEVKSIFGKGEDGDAYKLMQMLNEEDINYENKKAVHPSTLKAFVKEQIERGKSLPLDILGVYVGQKSEIRR